MAATYRRTLALVGILAATALMSAIPLFVDGWWLFIGSPSGPPPLPGRIAIAASSWIGVLAGLAAMRFRPGNPIGVWLTVTGLIGPIGFLTANGSVVMTLASAAAFATGAAAGIAILVAFPSGRLDRRALPVIAIAAVTAVVFRAQEVLFYDPTRSIAGWTEPNPFYVQADPAFLNALTAVLDVYGIAFLAGFGWWIARRWLRLSRPARRGIAPMLAGGLFFVATSILQASSQVAGVGGAAWDAVQFVHSLSFSAIPLGILGGMLRVRIARGAVADLVVELGETPEPPVLRRALAAALGDPSMAVLRWSPDASAYVDEQGEVVTSIEAAAGARAVTCLERDGRPLAAILHDPALLDDPGLVASVAAAVRLSVENARLEAAVKSQLAEVRASRGRIVEAADVERRRLERDIHDGAQQRLVALSLAIGRARAQVAAQSASGTTSEALESMLAQASEEARLALAELRELARGIHPAILTQAGLEPALASLAERSAVPTELDVAVPARPPAPVEATAYFLVAEALTNVARHAMARSACVTVRSRDGGLEVEVRDDGCGGATLEGGSGLRGLRDRVEALGGSFEVVSRIGSGTTIRAMLPFEPEPSR